MSRLDVVGTVCRRRPRLGVDLVMRVHRRSRRRSGWRVRVGVAGFLAGALVVGMVQPAAAATRVAPTSPSRGANTVPAGTAASSTDAVVNGWGDGAGYHVDVATAGSAYAWRTVAILRPGGIDDSSWTGYQCVSGDGRYAAVAVLPVLAVNRAAARDHGAFAFSVDLRTGAVRPVASGVGLKYHSPGCGVGEDAVFTLNPGSDQRSTRVVSVDLASGAVRRVTTVAGQVTSVVPAVDGLVGVLGHALVRLPEQGRTTRLSVVDGSADELRPVAGGGVDFVSVRPGSATASVNRERSGQVTVLGSGPRSALRLFGGRAGRPVAVGAASVVAGSGLVSVAAGPVGAAVTGASLDGGAVVGSSAPATTRPGTRSTTAGSTATGSTAAGSTAAGSVRAGSVGLPGLDEAPPVVATRTGRIVAGSTVAGATTPSGNPRVTTTVPAPLPAADGVPPRRFAAEATATATPATVTVAAAQTATCGVPRLAENRQVLQPWPAQIDWAAQMAEQGLLTGTAYQRPANYANMGLVAYAPNTDFSKIALSHPSSDTWNSVPRSVYEAIMAQESNWSQASWHAIPGIASDPLVADYYGAAGGITSIDYANADCGYGIGQVTTGMRATDTGVFSTNGKTKIAVDYQENIAAGLQILETTWNQLYAAGITANGGNPRYLENWYFAAWAYNTGIQPTAKYGNTTGCTPSPTCVGPDGTWGLGWTNNPKNPDYPPARDPYLKDSYADAAHPGNWPYEERVMGWMASPLIRLGARAYAVPTYNGGSSWLQIPPVNTFCTTDNKCDPTYVNSADPGASYCTLSDYECWWHQPVSWVSNCATTCATSSYAVGSGSTVPAGGADPHPPTCSLDTSKVPTTSSGAPIIVDESTSQPPLNLAGCSSTSNWSQGGTFTYTYGTSSAGDPIGAIDTHQLGAGFGGHILFTHTEDGSNSTEVNTGTWTPTLPKLQYYKIKLHLPATGASATDVVYKIYPGGGASPWKIRVNQNWQSEQWVTIGTFAMTNGGYVTLSNTSTDTAYGDSSYSDYDVAYDAIAFVQMGGTPGQPIGGPPNVIDAPKGSNPAWVQCGCVRRTAGDPVDTSTGYYGETFTDLTTPGRGAPLNFSRTYTSALADPSGPNASAVLTGPFGYGWTFSYNLSAATDATTGNVTIKQEDGSQVTFVDSAGSYAPSAPRYDATLTKSGTTYTYIRRSKAVYTFDTATGRLTAETDLAGSKAATPYATALAYDASGHLATITDPASRKYTLTWTGSHITGLTDTAGRAVTYAYSAAGDLTDVYGVGTTRTPSLLNDDHTVLGYTASHLLNSIRNPVAYGSTATPTPVLSMVYDPSERVTTQTDPLGHTTTFAYGPDSTLNLAAGQTLVTNPAGHRTLFTYANGLLTAETKGYGTADAGTWAYTFDPVSLGVTSVTDPNGNFQTFTYDDHGNRISASDARGYTTTYAYDDADNLVATIDPTGLQTTYGYDQAGHIATAAGSNDGTVDYGLLTSVTTGPVNASADSADGTAAGTTRTVNYYYDDAAHPADLSRTVTARGYTSTSSYDAAGDLASTTDPVGNVSRYGYNTATARRTSAVSPAGVAAGVAPGCTPPAKGCTSYGYDAWGHVTTTTDPLGHTTKAGYDADGNKTSATDGNNHTVGYTYDLADRLTVTTRPDGTVGKSDYNDDNSIADTLDGASHKTSYGYDNQGRRTTRTDPANRTVTWSYDPAGRVTSITDAGNRVTSYGYDAAGEQTTVTYSDGITPNVTATSHDPNGRPT